MPAIRTCKNCGQKNRIAANHLADDSGRCGACKTPLPPQDEPLQADTALFDEIIKSSRSLDAEIAIDQPRHTVA